MQRHEPAAELVVIGDGPLRPDYEALAAGLGVRCRFLGTQPPAVVREWMARAAVFCVPSVVAASGDAEGFGIVFIEAQAMGLPVVSTLSGGIPEAVKHGETGLLVAERNPRHWLRRFSQLMQDEELWRRYSLAGRKNVVRPLQPGSKPAGSNMFSSSCWLINTSRSGHAMGQLTGALDAVPMAAPRPSAASISRSLMACGFTPSWAYLFVTLCPRRALSIAGCICQCPGCGERSRNRARPGSIFFLP